MNEIYKENDLFKLLKTIEKEEQRDILAILKNLSIEVQGYQDFFNYQLKLTPLNEEDTTQLLKQSDEIKDNYETIILDDISIQGEKYLIFLLEYIKECFSIKDDIERVDKLISKLQYDKKIKEEISKYVKVDRVSIDEIKIRDMEKLLLSNQLKHKDNNDFINKIHEKFAFSPSDGEYGVKYLKGNNENIIHIFVNGFTNDSEEENYKDWIKESIDIIDENDTLYGYDWASGKKPVEHITKFIPYLVRAKGNPYLTIGTLLYKVRAEWKQARNHSELYSLELANFIEKQLVNNPMITINLYGHSLGANLLHYTLRDLYEKELKINDVFLFGGASEVNEEAWTEVLCSANNIYNYYSKNDQILTYLFQSMELASPIGLNSIKYNQKNKLTLANLYNYDVSDDINGHTKYIENFNLLYRYKYR